MQQMQQMTETNAGQFHAGGGSQRHQDKQQPMNQEQKQPLRPGALQQSADTGSTPEAHCSQGSFHHSQGQGLEPAGKMRQQQPNEDDDDEDETEGQQRAAMSKSQLYSFLDLPSKPAPKSATKNARERAGGAKERATQRRQRAVDPMSWDEGVVTVMIRQIPRQYSQLMMLKEVNRRGFEGLFDFLYLPFDLKKGINVGYGFVSFMDPRHAIEFREEFEGTYLDAHSNARGKPLHVHPASVQGYDANYSHFMATKTGQKQDPQFSPLFFPQGQPLDAATAGLIGGGLFAAHQAALVNEADRSMDKLKAQEQDEKDQDQLFWRRQLQSGSRRPCRASN
eukprot:gb/GFBE01035404.1/.p1 GENE.gb/GFBE01035404.1/~~gb/GFBE01035404.1/.p1  ORF type:complete len:337 (+),score=92.89 gb/GFBE01035404.1/:3-1013(+)